jgi:hypothetical protein
MCGMQLTWIAVGCFKPERNIKHDSYMTRKVSQFLELESKVLLYKTIIKPIWTYGIELWGCASKSHIAKMQWSQSNILQMIQMCPGMWLIRPYMTIYKYHSLRMSSKKKSINHHDKLGYHSNPILQPLMEQQQRRRLKKLWPADLIDGLRGFTHWRGPHHNTISTRRWCLTQHISLKSVPNSDC